MSPFSWLLKFVYKKLLQRFRVPRDVVRFAWRRYRDRVAVISPSGVVSYAQLREKVLRIAVAFEAMGLRKGDVCYVQLLNGGDMVVANLVAMETGIVISGLPRQADEEALARILKLIPPAVVLYDPIFEEAVAALKQWVPDIRLLRFDQVPQPTGPLGESKVRINPEDVANIGFTSGTTGAPKALAALHGTYLTSLNMVLDNVELKRQPTPDVALIGIPVAGAGSGLVMPTLLGGGTILIPAEFSASAFLRLIPQHGVTRLFTTPSLLIDLIDHPDVHHTNITTLRNIIYGTELMPAAKLEEALRIFGPILQQGYGSAEVLPPVTMLQPHEHFRSGMPAPRSVLSSVGHVVPRVEVMVADEDDGPLPQGAIGNILIKSPTQFRGYLQQDELNARILRGGWLHIGDIGYFDEESRLHILGRKPDLISRRGHVTYPRLVEEVMHDHPAVKETAYVQVGARALMALSLRNACRARIGDAVLQNELMDFLKARVPAEDVPDGIAIMDELPRSPLAKVLRREVRQALSN